MNAVNETESPIDDATQQTFKCFVIMPFSQTNYGTDEPQAVISEDEWTHIFTFWIKKAVESFPSLTFRCVRSPAQTGSFIKGIVQDLFDSDLVIADLTGGKANVYYELGIRHALDTGTIMITQNLASLPTDLKGYYTFEYTYAREHHEYERSYADFEKQMHEKIAYIVDNFSPSDNPVSDFLGQPNEYLRHVFENERNDLVFLAELFRDTVGQNYRVCESIMSLATTGVLDADAELPVFDFYPFDLLLSRFVNTRWQLMPMATLQAFNEMIQDTRRRFLSVHQGWHILRINPQSDANKHFFELLDALLSGRAENEQELLKGMVEAARNIMFSTSLTPRAEIIRNRENKGGAK